MVRVIVSGFFLLAGAVPGFAHGGHMGDLAGHSHWLGWGLVVAVGVIIAVIGSKTKDEQDDVEEIADEEIGGENTPSKT